MLNLAVFFGEALDLDAGFQADRFLFDELGVLYRSFSAR